MLLPRSYISFQHVQRYIFLLQTTSEWQQIEIQVISIKQVRMFEDIYFIYKPPLSDSKNKYRWNMFHVGRYVMHRQVLLDTKEK